MTAKMRKYLLALCFAFLCGGSVTPAISDESQPFLDKNLFSIGVGLSSNSIDDDDNDEDDEIGFQFFVAYDLTEVNLMEGCE